MLGKPVALHCAIFVPAVRPFTLSHSAINAIRKAQVGKIGRAQRSCGIIISFLQQQSTRLYCRFTSGHELAK
jgi:hypothetical protein